MTATRPGLLEQLRRWGWREVVYSAEVSILCRLGWHTQPCAGRRDHEHLRERWREVVHRWPTWPPPPPYLLIDRGGATWRDWIAVRTWDRR